MDKRFWAVLGVIAVFVVGAIWISNNNKANAPSSNAKPTNHIEGKGTTGVKLVEYGDYECPVCSGYYPTVKQVAAQFSDQIYFQFRNLPLTSIHQNAFAGARAAEAASLQGKFWQMHDLLYENNQYEQQTGWVVSSNPLNDYFVGFAQQLGLNINEFKTDYASEKVDNAINTDVNAFNKTKQAEGTPSFFLDGKYISNTQLVDSNGQPSVQKFAQVINAEIAKKDPSKK